MSIHVMAQVWRNGPSSATDCLLMLALADYANDDGECWPSIGGLARKARLSERGVQTALRRLEAGGWLKIETGGGRRRCNLYRIKTPQEMHPAGNAPRKETPQMNAETPQITAINPAPCAPEPSRTIIEPSSSTPRERDGVREALEAVASREAVASFTAYRRKSKAKALTLTAARRLAESLRAIIEGGGCADDALGLAEERGWQSIKPDWYFRETRNDNRPHHGRDPRADADARIIAFAARAGRAPSSDCF